MPEKSHKVGRKGHIEKNSWKKSHKAKRKGHIEEKCSKKSRLTGIRGHKMKEILYMSRQIEELGHIKKKNLHMSRQIEELGHIKKENSHMSRQIEGWDISSRNHAICPRGMKEPGKSSKKRKIQFPPLSIPWFCGGKCGRTANDGLRGTWIRGGGKCSQYFAHRF